MIKIIPILIGLIASYVLACFLGEVDFKAVNEAAWIGLPIHKSQTILGVDFANKAAITSAIIAIVPIALATIMEHIGDINAIGATTGHNYIKDPGLHRTLLGDGLATSLASAFGGPANTTYGENTGVLALTKIYDPKVIEIAACFAILLSFFPKVGYIIESVPAATIGGISLILYGMISAVGIRNMVENHVDFSRSRNTIIAALILVLALGLGDGITFTVAGTTITLSALATASLVGIIANAVLPGNEYVFKEDTEDEKDKFQTYEV
jgi:uracil permease